MVAVPNRKLFFCRAVKMAFRAESRSSRPTNTSPDNNSEHGVDVTDLIAKEIPVSHLPTSFESNY